MFYKLLSCLSVISVSAYGNAIKENLAVSTQSFNRPDIPISYKFTNIHNYKRNSNHQIKARQGGQSESDVKKYPEIQYAPLNLDTKVVNSNNNPQEEPDESTIHAGIHVYTVQEKSQLKNLEPKPLKEDDNVSQKNYKSFISGHNVQSYSHTTESSSHQSNLVNPFASRQELYLSQKAKSPKFVYNQKINEKFTNAPKLAIHVVDKAPPSEAFKFLEFLPPDYNPRARKEQKKPLPYSYSLHNHLLLEKQLQTYANPRIHLNIARSYNVANQPQEAHFPQILLPKMPALNNLLPLRSYNTPMLPI